MGTNYYWHPTVPEPCSHCGRPYRAEPLHIGKSSSGWYFSLHVTDDIPDLHTWESVWLTGTILDEYGEKLTPAEMLLVITARSRPDPVDWSDLELKRNYAERGRNNLVRHSMVLDDRCVGHGETWSLIMGEFS